MTWWLVIYREHNQRKHVSIQAPSGFTAQLKAQKLCANNNWELVRVVG